MRGQALAHLQGITQVGTYTHARTNERPALKLAVRFHEGRSGYLLRQTRRTRSHVVIGRGKRTANTLAILSRTLTA